MRHLSNHAHPLMCLCISEPMDVNCKHEESGTLSIRHVLYVDRTQKGCSDTTVIAVTGATQ